MIVTTLQAHVEQARADDLVSSFRQAGDKLPEPIQETFLLHGSDDLWEIVTVWRTREALDLYRSTVDTPAGVLMFRAAGAEPILSVFDVAAHTGAVG